MRIIRGHDYYDSALAYGRDDDIVFVREPKFIANRDTPFFHWNMADMFVQSVSKWGGKHVTNEVVIKDGKYGPSKYKMFGVTVYLGTKRFCGFRVDIKGTSHTFWSKDSLYHWAAEMGQEIHRPPKTRWNAGAMTIDEYFTPRDTTQKELDWMIENKVVTALWSDDVSDPLFDISIIGGWRREDHNYSYPWRCNAADPGNALKDYGVMKAMDAYSTMQELSMYVGGIMGGTPPHMVKITDDNTLVKKHGFDKWSFRKMPEPK